MIEIARSESRGAATFAVADAASLDFRDGVFDAVVSSSSLHEWSDPRAVTSELARVTRPGGRLVITDWCRDVPIFWPLALRLSLFDRSVEHIYSRAELEALLREASYAVEAATVYRVATFWGMMTVVARLRRGCQVSRLVGSRMCTSTRSSRDRRG
jgi:SAM-dependent methyltransferase